LKKEIVWWGPVYSYSGYAQHNRGIILGLKKLGWKIKLYPTENTGAWELIINKDLVEMVNNRLEDEEHAICINCVPPPAIGMWRYYNILLTTLESKTAHEGFLMRSAQYNEVWVPCRDNEKTLRKSKMNKKYLKVMPEGVDVDVWSPNKGILEKYKSKKYTFFFNGDWSWRKGIDTLIRSWGRAFHKTDNVRLLIQSHYQGCDDDKARDRIDQELEIFLEKYKIEDYAEITVLKDWFKEEEFPKLYNTVDCFIMPTRGEAWGLPIIQSMSCAKPVIVTGWGGQTDYVTKNTGYFIPVKEFKKMDEDTNLVVDFYKDQKFAYTDHVEVADIMQHVYENQIEAANKGRSGREHIIKNWTWQHAAAKVEKRLLELYGGKYWKKYR